MDKLKQDKFETGFMIQNTSLPLIELGKSHSIFSIFFTFVCLKKYNYEISKF